MFTFTHTTTAFLLKDPIDMRYGMFRLQGVIADMLQRPMPKDSFYFFINRSHTLLKGIWFDGTGQCIFSKRLEKGHFGWPQSAMEENEKWLQLHPRALTLLLDGIELKQGIRKAWYEV